MDRRDFLKLGGLFSAALFAQFNPLGSFTIQPVEVQSHGKLYRGTIDGKILLSTNAGKTWQIHTNFGTGCTITHLFLDRLENVRARLKFTGYPFELALTQDGKAWKTV